MQYQRYRSDPAPWDMECVSLFSVLHCCVVHCVHSVCVFTLCVCVCVCTVCVCVYSVCVCVCTVCVCVCTVTLEFLHSSSSTLSLSRYANLLPKAFKLRGPQLAKVNLFGHFGLYWCMDEGVANPTPYDQTNRGWVCPTSLNTWSYTKNSE